jgi:hypothetical protein
MKRRSAKALGKPCPYCHGMGVSPAQTTCKACGATIRWHPDNSVEVNVTGVADEVGPVTQLLAEGLTSFRAPPKQDAEGSPKAQTKWTRTRTTWAFVIGLATVAGGVAAVLALFIH